MWGQPLESHCNQLLLKSYSHFRFDGRHLESVVNSVGRYRHCHTQVGHGRKCGGSWCNYVCMLLETEVTSTNRKCPICPRMVPLIFQLAPSTGKCCLYARNVIASRISTPTYSTTSTTDLDMTRPTPQYVADYWFKMAATKPEVEMVLNVKRYWCDSNGCLPTFSTTPNIEVMLHKNRWA